MEKVLIVDNEFDICILVTKHLKTLGIDAEYSLIVKDALVKIQATRYPLYIIDLSILLTALSEFIVK